MRDSPPPIRVLAPSFWLDRKRGIWLWIYFEEDPYRGQLTACKTTLIALSMTMTFSVSWSALGLRSACPWLCKTEPGKPVEMAYVG